MAALIVISWRDVPAQVIVKRGPRVAKVQLSARFQEAVDRAAMRAGRGSSDAYLEDWRRSAPQPAATTCRPRPTAAAARARSPIPGRRSERLIRANGVGIRAACGHRGRDRRSS